MQTLGVPKTLYHLSLSPIRGEDHAERLESFYRGQSTNYDMFRRRLLHGRRELIESLPVGPQQVWLDIGAGTGENLEYAGARLNELARVGLVDLCPSLLSVARQRVASHGWKNVELIHVDAEQFHPPGGSVDLVTCSYSLSMIPDWISVSDNIWRMLRPGGHVGVVDFYVSRKHPPPGRVRHAWWTRSFWPIWFAADNVHLCGDLLPYLIRRFEAVRLDECRGRVPFLPCGRVPYFVFVGRKPVESDAAR